MKTKYFVFAATIFAVAGFSGCASKMAYLNTQKPLEEMQKDKSVCQAVVDDSDFKDKELRDKKFNDCMSGKGYEVVSEAAAEKTQGLKELWIKSGADLRSYDVILIEKVDVSQLIVDNKKASDSKVADEDVANLGDEMRKRFTKTVDAVLPVVTDASEASGKKALCLRLKLTKVSETDIGVGAALQVAGHFSPVPLPGAPEKDFSFKGEIVDSATQEKLLDFSDEVKGDKNSSLVGDEKFSHWQKAYNVMDYWADKLSALLAKQRGQKYTSVLKMKII